jgi:translation initiation factor 2 beta subunit (eIF-2beta)/eIF-5
VKLNKLKEKFVKCSGCRKISTLNYTNKDIEKSMKCTICGKIDIYKLKKNEDISS